MQATSQEDAVEPNCGEGLGQIDGVVAFRGLLTPFTQVPVMVARCGTNLLWTVRRPSYQFFFPYFAEFGRHFHAMLAEESAGPKR